MIGLTAGRETQRLNTLLKELSAAIPNSRISRRGKSSVQDLGRKLLDEGFDHAVALYRWHGGASGDATRLRNVLSIILELPEIESAKNAKCSPHVLGQSEGTIELVVASPPRNREIGPKLVISRLLWVTEG